MLSVTPGRLCQYRVGGLCVVLIVSYEKYFVNFNDFIVATIQQHWLPIQSTILFKVACIIYKVITTGQPHSCWSSSLSFLAGNRRTTRDSQAAIRRSCGFLSGTPTTYLLFT